MSLSVVIPTRDRSDLLIDCLRTLAEQGDPPSGFEVIVVDDGSDEPLAPLVTARAPAGAPVRCIRQAPGGLNAARNLGIESSTGDVVAFLDDDTLVVPDWARAMAECFEAEGCQAVGGRVVLRAEGGGSFPGWMTERRSSYLSAYDRGHERLEVEAPPFPVGANLAVRRDVLDDLGGFRAGLDRIGTELISNGELELLLRLRERGGRIVYEPAAEVTHRVPAERLTKAWFRRRARAQGVSDIRMEVGAEGSYAGRLARETLRMGRAAPILARRLVEGRGPFDAELWLIGCRARIVELRSRRAQES